MAKTVATKPRAANGGITAPKTAGFVGIKGSPRVPQVNQTGGTNRATSLNPLTKQYEAAQAAAAPSPAAAPATPYTGTPWYSAEQLSVAGADAKYNNALLNAGYKRTAYEQEYGLDQGFNDYKANPYSRAALLEKTYQRSQRSSGNSLAAEGQLYSGASQNAETYNREHDSQERNALEATYRKALQGVNEDEAGALNSREEEKANAKWKAVEAASNAELEPGASPAGSKASPYAEQAGGVVKKITDKKTGKSRVVGVSGARKAK